MRDLGDPWATLPQCHALLKNCPGWNWVEVVQALPCLGNPRAIPTEAQSQIQGQETWKPLKRGTQLLTKQGWTRSLGLWRAGEVAALRLVASNGTAAPLLGGPMLFCARKNKGGWVGGQSVGSLKKNPSIVLPSNVLSLCFSPLHTGSFTHSLTHPHFGLKLPSGFP